MGLKREKTPETDTETDTDTDTELDRSLQEARSLQLSALKKANRLLPQAQIEALKGYSNQEGGTLKCAKLRRAYAIKYDSL